MDCKGPFIVFMFTQVSPFNYATIWKQKLFNRLKLIRCSGPKMDSCPIERRICDHTSFPSVIKLFEMRMPASASVHISNTKWFRCEIDVFCFLPCFETIYQPSHLCPQLSDLIPRAEWMCLIGFYIPVPFPHAAGKINSGDMFVPVQAFRQDCGTFVKCGWQYCCGAAQRGGRGSGPRRSDSSAH